VRGLADGRKVITAAGTAERLSTASVGMRTVTIQALITNTGNIAIGGATVDVTPGSERGATLVPGAATVIGGSTEGEDDLRDIWIDAAVNGEGVSYFYGAT
jgi:hypothetical protein